MGFRNRYFDGAISRDFFDLFAGKKIGCGITRRVYECRQDKSIVLKIETGHGFQNVIEWETWDNVSYIEEIARWLAPCVDISPCGLVLLQRRVTPAREREYPGKMPLLFTDFKRSNYGMIGKRFVCCDYGTNRAMTTGATGRLRKVEWHD